VETLIKSSSAISGSFAPTFAYKNLEIHTVFLRFLTQNLRQNLSLPALANLIIVSLWGNFCQLKRKLQFVELFDDTAVSIVFIHAHRRLRCYTIDIAQ